MSACCAVLRRWQAAAACRRRYTTQITATEPNNNDFQETQLDEAHTRRSPAALYGSSRIGAVVLPDELMRVVAEQVEASDKIRLRQDALDLYAHLRASSIEPKKQKSSSNDPRPVNTLPPYKSNVVLAYAAGLMPAVYAATFHVLREVRKRAEVVNWRPTRVIDFGCGTASAGWAAATIWPDLKRYIGLDSSRPMIMLAGKVLKSLPIPHSLKQIDLDRISLRQELDFLEKAEQTIALSAYTLSELRHPGRRKTLVNNLCDTDAEIVVLIERGTPAGFKLIAEARQQILDMRDELPMHVIAPCPHDKACPLRFTPDFCHFSQRLEQPDFARKTKHSPHGEFDSSFSYVAFKKGPRPVAALDPELPETVSRNPDQTDSTQTPPIVLDHVLATPQQGAFYDMPPNLGSLSANTAPKSSDFDEAAALDWPRLIAPPMKRSGHVLMDACTASGKIERFIIPKSQGKQDYHDARKATWGDAFPHPPKKPSRIRDRGVRKLREPKRPTFTSESTVKVRQHRESDDIDDIGRHLAHINSLALEQESSTLVEDFAQARRWVSAAAKSCGIVQDGTICSIPYVLLLAQRPLSCTLTPEQQILYFAGARTSLGRSKETYSLPVDGPTTLAGLRKDLCATNVKNTEFVSVLSQSALSLNEEIIGRDEEGQAVVRLGDVVAIIPPVSGG